MKCEDKVRAFIGVPIAEDVRAAVARLQGRLRETRVRVRWVREENLHVTLFFLGDIAQEGVQDAVDALTAATAGLPAFRCAVQGVGSFGKPRSPRVIWAGVEEGKETLRTLYNRLGPELERRGHRIEKRRYTPHITIGRVRSASEISSLVEQLASAKDRDFGGFRVESVCLFRSVLQSSGPVYSMLHEAALTPG